MRQLVKLLLILCISPVEFAVGQPLTRVVVAEADEALAVSTITLVGTVQAARHSRVGTEVAGLVSEMPVRQGDYVTTGQPLCRLDDTAWRIRLRGEQARLSALDAAHEELINGTRPEEISRRKALLNEMVAECDRWKFESERIQRLYKGSESNEKEFTDTISSYSACQARVAAAEAELLLAQNGPRKEQIARAAQEAAEQRAIVERMEHDITKTVIVAPYDGYVSNRIVEVGEWIPVGGAVAELVELSTVLVRVDVPEYAIPFVREGAQARVAIDALKNAFNGRVRHIIRKADEQARTFPVEIEIQNKDGVLLSGMFARATLPAGPEEKVVAVPKDAIVDRGGVAHVAVVLPGDVPQAILQPVTVGAAVGDRIAVTSVNIRVGDRVIVRGNERIMPFPTPILIVDENGTPIPVPAGAKSARKEGDA